MPRGLRRFSLALLLAHVACAAPEPIAAPTQVTVRLSSADEALTTRLTELRVSASVYERSGWRTPVMNSIPTAGLPWPIDVPVHPRNAKDASKGFEFVVEGFQNGQRLLQQRAVTTFVAGRHLEMPLLLYECPPPNAGLVCAPDGCHGPDCTVCSESGACDPVGVIDPSTLVSAAPTLEAGTPTGDAGMEAGVVSFDAAVEGGALSPNDVVAKICAACDPAARCVLDQPGGAACVCSSGYVGDGTVCTRDVDCDALGCDPNAVCVDLGGQKGCECRPGYTGDGTTCVDIDECSTPDRGGCSIDADCMNTPGGYRCTCHPEFLDVSGDGHECTAKCSLVSCDLHAKCNIVGDGAECTCISPYVGDGTECHVDETCTTLNCDPHATCVVNGATPSCRCMTGYEGSGSFCQDINECLNGTCDSNATCRNTEGGYSCECNEGYTGSGTVCSDIDECQLYRPCDSNATCTNTIGSYSCRCNSGYDGDGTTCEPHDYCGSAPCLHGRCSSSPSGYTCDCTDTGWTGSRCQTQVDDCAVSPCLNGATCVDGNNSYTCKCAAGYQGDRCELDRCANNGGCSAGYTCQRWDPSIPPYAIAICRPQCYPNCATGQGCLHDDDCTSGVCVSAQCS